VIEARTGPSPAADAFDLRKKVLRLETLYDISRSLSSVRDEDLLLEEVATRAVGVLDAARGFAAAFEDGPGSGSTASVGSFPSLDLLAISSDPFVLDLCRAKTPL